MTEHDRLTEALRSMQPEMTDASTEHALSDVHDRSHRRGRHHRFVRGAIGAAAAVLLISGAVAVANLGGDDSESVAGDQTEVPRPTATTTAVEDWTSSTIETTTTTVPDRLSDADLYTVTGIELRTWYFDEQVDGFWTADPALVDAVVEALRTGAPPVPEPEWTDEATIRFEQSDGTYLFRRIDLESGWVEPDQQLPQDLVRQLRTGFNDAVASPWEEVDLTDPNSYHGPVFADTFPIRDLDAVVPALNEARKTHRLHAYGRWFIDVVIEGHGPKVEIRHRGIGGDSARGVDYFFSLVDTPDGWDIGGAMLRSLCLRSTPLEVGDPDPACL